MTRRVYAGVIVAALAAGVGACGGEAPENAAPPAPLASPVDAATAGNIMGRITFEGTPPQPGVVRMDSDPNCVQSGVTATDETLVVEDYRRAPKCVRLREGRSWRPPVPDPVGGAPARPEGLPLRASRNGRAGGPEP